MNYRVEEYAVVIASKDIPLETLETRIYPLEKSGITDFGGEADTEDGTASVKDYFERRGVDFPAEARIVYDASISRLIATNTHENLRKIEQIIDELNVVDPQVLIESKFVEIQENKANELGFDWTVSKHSDSGIQFDQNDQLLRFDKDIAGNEQRLKGKDVAFDLTRTNNKGIRINMKVHAMDLQSRADILSTPRITTQNGEEATIRMVTDVYFPETWGETTIVTDPTGTGFSASMPEFGDPTELGVRLTVTPTVDPDKYTISLDMVPVVQTQVDWTDYSYTVPTADIDNNLIYLPNVLKMPIIEARTVQTQITIYDGETVVLGGIMRDLTGTVDDRIPLLGDLPLVGRMFRSKLVDKRKANLLIFTTVRLVNPDGSPLREREVRGKPPFRL
jgi:type II secretory pathway component GspD/PulD (secretin)